MNRHIRVDTTAISRVGLDYSENEGNFFINGRYMYEFERENIQVSVEKQGEEYIFAVSDGMDRVNSEKGTSISMMKEIKKFHEKIRGTGGDLGSKLMQMKEKVDEVNNIIYSMNIGSHNNHDKATSFAGICIFDGMVAALSVGKCKAYLLRDEKIKLLTGEGRKADRLLKMGIITTEQAKAFSDRVAIGNGQGNTELQKSDVIDIKPGDVLLVCSAGITNTLDDDRLHEILAVNKDSSFLANLLVKEALKNGEKDSVTALVARVECAESSTEVIEEEERQSIRKRHKQNKSTEKENARTIIAAVIACILVIGILSVVFYKAWIPEKVKDNDAVSAVTTAQSADMTTVVGEEKQQVIDEIDTKDQTSDQVEEQKNSSNNDQASEVTEENKSSEKTDDSDSGENTDNLVNTDNSDNTDDTDSTGETVHVVKSGDTLQEISKKYYGKMEKYELIMQKNNITNPNSLKVGQKLIIPKE